MAGGPRRPIQSTAVPVKANVACRLPSPRRRRSPHSRLWGQPETSRGVGGTSESGRYAMPRTGLLCLPTRHSRQHLVDETGGAFGHPPAPTTRTEAASLAGEGHEALEGAVHRSRVKPWARTPHERNSRNSCSTKRARPLPPPRSETSRRKGSRCSLSRGRYLGWGGRDLNVVQ